MFKSKDALMKPDTRNDQSVRDAATNAWRPMEVEDLHALMQSLELGPSVPENIRQQFDTARNAFIYSWFDYDFVTLAEHQSYTVLEMALRERIVRGGGDPSVARGLQNLCDIAFKFGCIRRADFEMPSPFNLAQVITKFEIVRLLRNSLSHGQMHLLPDGSLQMMRLCAEIIGQLYPAPATK
jgi:hypothetical protein